MDVQYFPIDKVQPNPYQMRLTEDEAHVAGLAEDIAVNGLLQIPTGRPHPKKPGVVELAFGHSRLAAYRRLAANGRVEDYSNFPLVIKELNDRQMSDLAASENARRKNLSPIETARAIHRRKKDFKLGNAEAGAPFGLGESAVSNMLRLLDLPADVQAQVDSGELPQRLARQLVNVNRTDPKTARQIAKVVAKAPAAEREEALADAMADHVKSKLALYNVPWKPDWPAPPFPLEAQQLDPEGPVLPAGLARAAQEAGLTELRACAGCPHRLVYGDRNYCTLAACYQAKLALFDEQVGRRVCDRFGIPRAAAGEQVSVLDNVIGDQGYLHSVHEPRVARLLAAAKKQPDLGLRVITGQRQGWFWERILKDERVALGTTAPAAVKAFIKAASAKAVKPAKGEKAPTPAQAANARAAEEAAAEARRAERAAKQRELHDCAWLVRHVTPIIAEQLTISGPVLDYVVAEMQHVNDSGVGLFPDLGSLYEDLRDAVKQAPEKERDGLLRQMLVAGEILHRVFDYSIEHYVRQGKAWAHVRGQINELATAGLRTHNAGFGATLPRGWDKAPVHQTPVNCWQCGQFTGGGRVTKRDQTAGWLVRGQAEAPEGVWCSAAHQAAFVKAAGKAAKS